MMFYASEMMSEASIYQVKHGKALTISGLGESGFRSIPLHSWRAAF